MDVTGRFAICLTILTAVTMIWGSKVGPIVQSHDKHEIPMFEIKNVHLNNTVSDICHCRPAKKKWLVLCFTAQ